MLEIVVFGFLIKATDNVPPNYTAKEAKPSLLAAAPPRHHGRVVFFQPRMNPKTNQSSLAFMETMLSRNPLFSRRRRLPQIEPSIWSRSPLSIVSPSMTVIQAKSNVMAFRHE